MNRADLEFRLQELSTAIAQTNAMIQQQMGNMNVLIGRKEEVLYSIQKLDDKNKEILENKEVQPDEA